MNKTMYLADFLYAKLPEKTKKLTINSANTVQPVALMRLPVFVPTQKRKATSTIDASAELSQLEFSRMEGYDEVKIWGPVLNMDVDFKVWIGIIYSFSKYGLSDNKITLKFTEFAKYCGFPSKRMDRKLRDQLDRSMERIGSTRISFRKGGKEVLGGLKTGLLLAAYWDEATDTVMLQADERLWELYAVDLRVLLQLDAITALPRKEVAQAIYTFIESLPARPAPLSFKRLRERLAMNQPIMAQNRYIKTAVADLIKIGYLTADIVQKDGDNHLLIHRRNPKLRG